jgi:hypothetical protein
MNESIKMGTDHCPECGYEVDRATEVTGDSLPAPGDISICFKCGAFLQFSSDMALIKLPDVIFDTLNEEMKLTMRKARLLILSDL